MIPTAFHRGLRYALVAALAVLAGTPFAPAGATHDAAFADSTSAADSARVSDPKSIEIADRVMRVLGGRDHWDAVRGLEWTFEVARHDSRSGRDSVLTSRRHAWDKRTHWHRVSGTTPDGTAFLVMHKLGATQGSAWIDGKPVEGDDITTWLHRADSLWVHDGYLMFLPYKLRDPGVILKYGGIFREGDDLSDVLAVSFDHPAEPAGSGYEVYVNRATRRVDSVLIDPAPPRTIAGPSHEPPGTRKTPRLVLLYPWEQHGDLWFPVARFSPSEAAVDGSVGYFRNIELRSSFPAAEFSQP